eukprot:9091545-Pyramimonas_sp.AAC.1
MPRETFLIASCVSGRWCPAGAPGPVRDLNWRAAASRWMAPPAVRARAPALAPGAPTAMCFSRPSPRINRRS